MNDKPHDNLNNLFPGLTEEEHREVKFAIQDYLRFIVRLHEAIRANPERKAKFEEMLRGMQKKKNEDNSVLLENDAGKPSASNDR